MVSMLRLMRITLSVLLVSYFQKRHTLSVNASALELAFITGFNEKTICGYKRDYFSNKGRFFDSVKGKYERLSLFNDEDISLEAFMWVQESAHKKGDASMAASFFQFVNDHLLPSSTQPPNYPSTITVLSATRWLHPLGIRPMSHKKGNTAMYEGHNLGRQRVEDGG